MKKIEHLSNKIKKEIENAAEYAKDALELKETDPETAEVYYERANSRLNDMTALHARVVAIINQYKQEHGDIPESMKIIYQIKHREHIENAAAVKGMLVLYKEDQN